MFVFKIEDAGVSTEGLGSAKELKPGVASFWQSTAVISAFGRPHEVKVSCSTRPGEVKPDDKYMKVICWCAANIQKCFDTYFASSEGRRSLGHIGSTFIEEGKFESKKDANPDSKLKQIYEILKKEVLITKIYHYPNNGEGEVWLEFDITEKYGHGYCIVLKDGKVDTDWQGYLN